VKFRWSNGYNRAVEFENFSAKKMMCAMTNALIEFRRDGTERAELHVETIPGRWEDPIFHYPDQGVNFAGHEHCFGRTHVIECCGRIAPDSTVTACVRGTDYVLIIGAGNWHAEDTYRACGRAILGAKNFHGFIADVVAQISDSSSAE
jgi:hypothetical protein